MISPAVDPGSIIGRRSRRGRHRLPSQICRGQSRWEWSRSLILGRWTGIDLCCRHRRLPCAAGFRFSLACLCTVWGVCSTCRDYALVLFRICWAHAWIARWTPSHTPLAHSWLSFSHFAANPNCMTPSAYPVSLSYLILISWDSPRTSWSSRPWSTFRDLPLLQ